MTLARTLIGLVKSGDVTITSTKKIMCIDVNNCDIPERDIANPALLIHMFALLSPYLVTIDNGTIYNDIIVSTYNYNGKTIKIFE